MHYLQDNILRWLLVIDDIVLIHHLNDDIIGFQTDGVIMFLVDHRQLVQADYLLVHDHTLVNLPNRILIVGRLRISVGNVSIEQHSKFLKKHLHHLSGFHY